MPEDGAGELRDNHLMGWESHFFFLEFLFRMIKILWVDSGDGYITPNVLKAPEFYT